MGESSNAPLKVCFDRRVQVEFHGSTITSDAGLLAARDLDDALGLTETATACLQESRGGRNLQHRLVFGGPAQAVGVQSSSRLRGHQRY